MSLVKNSINEESLQPVTARSVVSHVKDRRHTGIPVSGTANPPSVRYSTANKASRTIYQFKFTLIDSKPLIWRRIKVADGTFDKLHEHIQTAMGWTNLHLHQFWIDGKLYGDPALLVELFDDSNCVDSTRIPYCAEARRSIKSWFRPSGFSAGLQSPELCPVVGFAFMLLHRHLGITPQAFGAFSLQFRQVLRRCTSTHVYPGRFFASVVLTETHFLQL